MAQKQPKWAWSPAVMPMSYSSGGLKPEISFTGLKPKKVSAGLILSGVSRGAPTSLPFPAPEGPTSFSLHASHPHVQQQSISKSLPLWPFAPSSYHLLFSTDFSCLPLIRTTVTTSGPSRSSSYLKMCNWITPSQVVGPSLRSHYSAYYRR